MKNFIMKALTRDNATWFTFSVEDIPAPIDQEMFSLMAIPNSPLLQLSTIRRGDRDTMLFEGEVIQKDGTDWMVCYERGFYAISADYTVRKLGELTGCTKIGDINYGVDFPVSICIKRKLLFKYRNTVFRLESICGCYHKKLLLRSSRQPINPDKIQQDCGCEYDGKQLYLGDTTSLGTVVLSYGVIGFNKAGHFVSLESLRKENGCNQRCTQ